MTASFMMIFQLLTLFLIPFILAVFMSGRSLILIFFGALTSQATVAVAFSLLSSRDGAECMGMGALSLVFYVIALSRIENNKDGLNEQTGQVHHFFVFYSNNAIFKRRKQRGPREAVFNADARHCHSV